MSNSLKQNENIIVPHTFNEFLNHCHMFNLVGAAIAIIDKNNHHLYKNNAYEKLCTQIQHRLLFKMPGHEQITACLSQRHAFEFKTHSKLQNQSGIHITFNLQPIICTDSDDIQAIMVSVKEESIETMIRSLHNNAYLEESKLELANTIKTLSKEKITKDKLIRSLLKDTPFAIMLVDTKCHILQINHACEEIIQQKNIHTTGQTCDQYLLCYQKYGYCPVVERNQKIYLDETTGSDKTGCNILLLRNAVLLDHDDEIIVMDAFIDITEHKKAETESYEARAMAEKHSLERKLAESANKAKSTFLARMSHELRTPMNAILGYSDFIVEIMEDDIPSCEDIQHSMSNINNAGQHLLALINDVLDLSKIEAERMELLVEPCDVKDICQHVISSLDHFFKKQGNALKIICEGEITTFNSDATRIKQILYNLLSNACKFTENGTISLKVNITNIDNQRWLNIAVQDTGIGMTAKQVKNVFNEFAQAEITTTRDYGGTGLGLTICKKLATLMNGNISVTSTPGGGSCFIMTIKEANLT